jgi:hypothetical protein
MRLFNNKYTRTARPFQRPEPRNLTPQEIFAVVFKRYRSIQGSDIQSSLKRSLRDREFLADVEITARRTLSPRQYSLFRIAYIWERSNELIVAQRIGYVATLDVLIARTRIEELLGVAFKSVKPYPLYPLAEYFRDPERKEN